MGIELLSYNIFTVVYDFTLPVFIIYAGKKGMAHLKIKAKLFNTILLSYITIIGGCPMHGTTNCRCRI